MRIAITGPHGQLGGELCRRYGALAAPLERARFPLEADESALAETLPPDLAAVVNTAAYTLVDQAEREPEACFAANALGVERLARICAARDIPLVQVSTDYVFGAALPTGHQPTPWREEDPVAPQGVYARSKLAGEEAAARCPRHWVVRTCGLYGPLGRPEARPHFVATMLRLARAGKALKVVHDQHCTPTYVPHLARAIQFLVDQAIAGKIDPGVYHLTNRGAVTWHDFAAEIFRLKGLDVSLAPTTAAAYGAPAPRPSYSVLDTAKYHALGGPPMPAWHEALAEYLATIE